ncbi:hypothetical protein B5D80_19635 [Micromonospora wenchangensis]|uniref:TnsA-like heteromeric transposase endonuclease subunit n=2 Tax=Micromonospora wenchangensis TaxID=1185415 RepID=A0A246RJ32_9ACTN|nr:hypothetical protein B5D80_19635 [Micromonospora wenchangensis]
MQPFESLKPVRPLSPAHGRRGFVGLWWFATTGDHVGYQSWRERDHVMGWDFDLEVVRLASRPLRFAWQSERGVLTHTPAFFARLHDGTAMVADVLPGRAVDDEDATAPGVVEQACAAVGWGFRRVAGMSEARTANLRWLSGYRHPRCLHPARAADLVRVFAGGAELMEGVRRVGDPIAVLPTVFHLLWRQVLRTDLDAAPLGAGSLVRGGGE